MATQAWMKGMLPPVFLSTVMPRGGFSRAGGDLPQSPQILGTRTSRRFKLFK